MCFSVFITKIQLKKEQFNKFCIDLLNKLYLNLEHLYIFKYLYFNIIWTPTTTKFLYMFFFKINYIQYIYFFYTFFKKVLLAIIISIVLFIGNIYFFKISFLKYLAIWWIIGFLVIWLFSGFNFFLKKYKYSKFTTAIQRFWKQTNSVFWCIEGFLFCLFFYYYLNSSQEPLFMYDNTSLNLKYFFFSKNIIFSISLIAITIFLVYIYLLINIYLNFFQKIFLLLVITLHILYFFYIETYQFYYVITFFQENLWVFDEDINSWFLESETPILRLKYQYFIMCLLAKYWHFIFIFFSWLFFIIKSFEIKKCSITLLGLNFQNLIILYILNILCYIQIIKFIFKRYLELQYFWFFLNPNIKISEKFIIELKNIIYSLFSIKTNSYNIYTNYIQIFFTDTIVLWKII